MFCIFLKLIFYHGSTFKHTCPCFHSLFDWNYKQILLYNYKISTIKQVFGDCKTNVQNVTSKTFFYLKTERNGGIISMFIGLLFSVCYVFFKAHLLFNQGVTHSLHHRQRNEQLFQPYFSNIIHNIITIVRYERRFGINMITQ